MVNRGACLGWLSQYPDEREILMPVRITECSTRMAVVSPVPLTRCASSRSLRSKPVLRKSLPILPTAYRPQPLTGLEVIEFEQLHDKTLLFTMGLNINLQSMTIEQVLAVRKTQCTELANVVQRSLENERDHPPNHDLAYDDDLHRQRFEGLLDRAKEDASLIEDKDFAWFNDNANFVACVHALV